MSGSTAEAGVDRMLREAVDCGLAGGNHRETWPGGGLNMADHRNGGLAAIDAVRDAANRWLFPELGLQPWNGVRWGAAVASPLAGHAAEVSTTFDRASRRWPQPPSN